MTYARLNTPLRNYFFYKQGLQINQPLSDGRLNFYKNSDHSESGRLDVYQDREMTIPYSNPLILDGDGGCAPIYLQDESYFIQVLAYDGSEQFTISDYEGAMLTAPPIPPANGAVSNLFGDGQFSVPLYEFATLTPSSLTGTRFQRITSESNLLFADVDRTGQTGTIGLERFPLGDESVPQTPTYYFHYNCTGGGSGGTFTGLYWETYSVEELENTQITVSFWARSTMASSIDLKYVQGFSSLDINTVDVQTFTLTSTWTQYSATFTTDSTAGKTLGSDDRFQILWEFPLNQPADIQITNLLGEEGPVVNEYPFVPQGQYYVNNMFITSSDLDRTPGYLYQKIVGGNGINIVEKYASTTPVLMGGYLEVSASKYILYHQAPIASIPASPFSANVPIFSNIAIDSAYPQLENETIVVSSHFPSVAVAGGIGSFLFIYLQDNATGTIYNVGMLAVTDGAGTNPLEAAGVISSKAILPPATGRTISYFFAISTAPSGNGTPHQDISAQQSAFGMTTGQQPNIVITVEKFNGQAI